MHGFPVIFSSVFCLPLHYWSTSQRGRLVYASVSYENDYEAPVALFLSPCLLTILLVCYLVTYSVCLPLSLLSSFTLM